jgi:hypothetical protein
MSLPVDFRHVPYKDVRARAAEALPDGERLLGSEVTLPGHRLPKPRRGRRPRVLLGLRMPGDRLAGVSRVFWRLVPLPEIGGFDWLFEWRRRHGKPLEGGWNSLGGHLAAALWPVSKTTGVLPVLQLTDRRLRIAYVQRARRRGARQLGVVEQGWSTEAHHVAWIRHRTDVDADTYEIGFTDGSWARVCLPSHGAVNFFQAFPEHLRQAATATGR